MYTSNQFSRMSRLGNHNKHSSTDNLYQPLRNALRKSTVSPNFLSPHPQLPDNRLSASRITKNFRSFSPAETEIIKKSIFIPLDKELVPTRNLQKVMGKQFVTVDVEERVGEAISPDQFNRVKTGTVEEIVYQIKDEEPPYSIYTLPVQNRSTMQLPPPISQSHYRPSQPQIVQLPKTNIYTSYVQSPRSIQQTYPSQENMISPRARDSGKIQGVIESVKQNNILRQSNEVNKVPFNTYQSTALPTVKSQQFIKEKLLPSPPNSLVHKQENKRQAQNVRAYDFRQSTASKQDSMIRARRQKQQYRYNLFSLIDEGGNNGCKNGCFGRNQFCAPKISSNPWK